MRVFKCMFCFLTEFSSIFHPTCHGCLQKLGRPGSILQQVVVGGGGCGSRVIIWEVGEGGWCKRKNLQISDVQRLASLQLSREPTLACFRLDVFTFVITDASPVGLGAILLQDQDQGECKPIAYISRSLTSTETRYSQIERKALGSGVCPGGTRVGFE